MLSYPRGAKYNCGYKPGQTCDNKPRSRLTKASVNKLPKALTRLAVLQTWLIGGGAGGCFQDTCLLGWCCKTGRAVWMWHIPSLCTETITGSSSFLTAIEKRHSYDPGFLQLKDVRWLVRDATCVPSALPMLWPLQPCRALYVLFAHLSGVAQWDLLPGARHACEGGQGRSGLQG